MKVVKEPISVVIPCFNKRDLLDKTLMSLMPQLEKGDEVLVADDGSTDRVDKLLNQYYPSVRYASLGPRKGWRTNSARNLGINKAKNPLVYLLDADCQPQPFCLQRLRAKAGKGVYVAGLVGYEVPYKKQLEQAKKMKGYAVDFMYMGNLPIEKLIAQFEAGDDKVVGTVGCNVVFHVDDAKAVGLFDEDYNGCWGYAELDFMIKLHYNGVRFVNLQKREELALVMHQSHPTDMKWKERCLKRQLKILREKYPAYKRREFPKKGD